MIPGVAPAVTPSAIAAFASRGDAPQIPVTVNSIEYARNIDPALTAILAAPR